MLPAPPRPRSAAGWGQARGWYLINPEVLTRAEAGEGGTGAAHAALLRLGPSNTRVCDNSKTLVHAGAGEDGAGAAHAAPLRLGLSIMRVYDKP